VARLTSFLRGSDNRLRPAPDAVSRIDHGGEHDARDHLRLDPLFRCPSLRTGRLGTAGRAKGAATGVDALADRPSRRDRPASRPASSPHPELVVPRPETFAVFGERTPSTARTQERRVAALHEIPRTERRLLDQQPAAGLKCADHPLARSIAFGQVQEHQTGVHQVRSGPRRVHRRRCRRAPPRRSA